MPLTIKNTTKRALPFNLTHAGLRDLGAPYGYKIANGATVDVDNNTGARRPRATRRMVPATITFLADETREGLPVIVKECPEIAAALRPGGPLRLVRETPDVVAAPAEGKPAAALSEGPAQAAQKGAQAARRAPKGS